MSTLTLDSVPVHPWTRRWWDSLPETYRVLDAVTTTPRRGTWTGFNADPVFAGGWDSWTTTAPSQGTDFVTVRLSRPFGGGTPSKTVSVQIWSTAINGASIVARIADGERAELATVSAPEGKDAESRMAFLPPRDGRFSMEIDVTIPADAPAGSADIIAVAIGDTPTAYADLPTDGGTGRTYPLLRWMDGIGRIAGEVSDAIEAAWDGTSIMPETAPNQLIPWLAQMTGVPVRYRQDLTPDQLRQYIIAVRDAGLPPAGSRAAISEAARQYLTGSRMVSVIPGDQPLHLLILVKADEVPGGDIAAFADFMVRSGAVPAGHTLQARTANPSWDSWEMAAGTTWADKERRLRNWLASDSAGVTL